MIASWLQDPGHTARLSDTAVIHDPFLVVIGVILVINQQVLCTDSTVRAARDLRHCVIAYRMTRHNYSDHFAREEMAQRSIGLEEKKEWLMTTSCAKSPGPVHVLQVACPFLLLSVSARAIFNRNRTE